MVTVTGADVVELPVLSVPTSDALAVTVTLVLKAKLDPDASDLIDTTGDAAPIWRRD